MQGSGDSAAVAAVTMMNLALAETASLLALPSAVPSTAVGGGAPAPTAGEARTRAIVAYVVGLLGSVDGGRAQWRAVRASQGAALAAIVATSGRLLRRVSSSSAAELLGAIYSVYEDGAVCSPQVINLVESFRMCRLERENFSILLLG